MGIFGTGEKKKTGQVEETEAEPEEKTFTMEVNMINGEVLEFEGLSTEGWEKIIETLNEETGRFATFGNKMVNINKDEINYIKIEEE